jgi:hypothetical protein
MEPGRVVVPFGGAWSGFRFSAPSGKVLSILDVVVRSSIRCGVAQHEPKYGEEGLAFDILGIAGR